MLYQGLLVLLLLQYGEAAKIGIFTAAFSNSQMVFNMRIAESLAEDGHDVVLIRPEYNPQSTSLKSTNPKIREIHTKAVTHEVFKRYQDIAHRQIFDALSWLEFMDLSNAYKAVVMDACKNMLANDEFIQQIKAENIELAFHHHIDFCQHGIAHHLGIKKWVMTMPGPMHSLILEDLGIPFFDDNPTTKLMREKFGDDFIHISDLRKQAILAFVNNDPLLEYPYPHTNQIQFIGGIGTKKHKKFKEPFSSFAEKAKKIVVVSFGSVAVASDMPEAWKTALIQLFSENPDISFVWKFEEEIKVPENVLRSKWLPQNDLLALNKTVGFITHGGYNSLGEAVHSGTPCVFIPLFADQFRNSMLAQYRGIGIQQPKQEFTFESLNNKLHEILNNPKYLLNIRKYQQLAKGRLNTADQILRYWTNLILTHDLNLSLPRLNKFQLYNIDIYLLLTVPLLIFLFIVKTLVRWYYWSCCEMAYKEKEKIQ